MNHIEQGKGETSSLSDLRCSVIGIVPQVGFQRRIHEESHESVATCRYCGGDVQRCLVAFRRRIYIRAVLQHQSCELGIVPLACRVQCRPKHFRPLVRIGFVLEQKLSELVVVVVAGLVERRISIAVTYVHQAWIFGEYALNKLVSVFGCSPQNFAFQWS